MATKTAAKSSKTSGKGRNIRRKFGDEHKKILNKLRLGTGGHSSVGDRIANQQGRIMTNTEVCVMEAIELITGSYEHHGVQANPICVSPVITEFMINLNDSRTSKKELSRLKTVIPEIMGTCPITVKGKYEVRAPATKAYTALEQRRQKRIGQRLHEFGVEMCIDPYEPNQIEQMHKFNFRTLKTKDGIKLARELAAMK